MKFPTSVIFGGIRRAAVAAALLLAAAAPAAAVDLVYNWGAPKVLAHHKVGPGMTYMKVVYPDKPLILWFVEVDLSNEYAKIEQVQSRHAVPDPLRWDVMTHYRENSRPGHQVKVAWNHDFFSYDAGVCIGLNISEGEVTWTKTGRSLLAITDDGRGSVFYPVLESFVTTADGTRVDIDYYNALNGGIYGDCVLYNRFNAKTLTEEGVYVVVEPLDAWTVNGDPVRCRVKSYGTEPAATAPDGSQYVLYLRGSKLAALEGHVAPGEEITVTQRFSADGWGDKPARILNAFHGYPSIVHDGVLHEGEFNNFENGREYELSSRVMVGLSKDKTKLYIATTEMSAASKGVDCIELSAWLVEHGAWDVVNFDSGGSAAIVIDEQMLNIPGRGSVRPVQDAMLAVSLAPDDPALHHLAFDLMELRPTVMSGTPLRVIGYNQYDEIVADSVDGCAFRCEPSTLGYVDAQGTFHAGTDAAEGRIIASFDGMETEIPITLRPVADISSTYTSFLIDDQPRPICGIKALADGLTTDIDPAALAWTVEPEGILTVDQGHMRGIAEGSAKVSTRVDDIDISFDVKVEIAHRQLTAVACKDADEVNLTKTAAVKNLDIAYATDSDRGMRLSFDLATGRGSNIKIAPDAVLYSIPEAISIGLVDPDAIVQKLTVTVTDALGKNVNIFLTPEPDTDRCIASFRGDNQIDFYRYPLTLKSISFMLANKNVTGTSLTLGPVDALYRDYGAIPSVPLPARGDALTATVDGNTLRLSGTDAASAAVYDITGRLLLTAPITDGAIDITPLPRGIYIVTAQTSATRFAR